MMNANSTLGICIPTYKRPDQLLACVKSIIESAGSTHVPVYISDDSADDTNVAAVESLRNAYPHIIHERNARNLGIDRNILKSVDICQCRYAWLMGEDDRMKPEAIPTVLDIAGRNDAQWPFIYINYASVDASFKRVLKKQSLDLSGDVERDAIDFLRREAWSMGFIGACVVQKSAWAKVNEEPYVGTYFAHVGVIMESLCGRNARLIAKPLVLNRCSTPEAFSWKNSTFEVLGGWEKVMDLLIPLYGTEPCRESVGSFEKAHGLNNLKFLFYARSGGALDKEVYERHIRHGNYSSVYKAAALLVSVLPPFVFRWAQWILHRVVGSSLNQGP
jgi:glycosyltransferase involved in cell wall biosynthesis